jgi:hypothetical protein
MTTPRKDKDFAPRPGRGVIREEAGPMSERQPSAAVRKSGTVTFRVPRPLYERLEKILADEGISMADWGRDVILQAVRKAEREQARRGRG